MKDLYDFANDMRKRQVLALGQAIKDRFGGDQLGDGWDVDTLRALLNELVMNNVFTLDVCLSWLVLNVNDSLVAIIIKDWVWFDVDGIVWKRKSWEQRQKESLEALKNA